MFSLTECKNKYAISYANYQKLNDCIRYYSKPISVGSLLYRTVNAVKHVFGKSDWQKNKKILVDCLSKNSSLKLSELKLAADMMLRYLLMQRKGLFVEPLSAESLIKRASFRKRALNILNTEAILKDLKRHKKVCELKIKTIDMRTLYSLDVAVRIKVSKQMKLFETYIENYQFSPKDPGKKLYNSLIEIIVLKQRINSIIKMVDELKTVPLDSNFDYFFE